MEALSCMEGLWHHPAYSCHRTFGQLHTNKPPGDGDVRSKGCRQRLYPQHQRPSSIQSPRHQTAKVRQRELVGQDGRAAAFCGQRRSACPTCTERLDRVNKKIWNFQLKNSLVGPARGGN